MNRRSFFKIAAGVLAGACGAGWLWSRKPEEITFKGMPITWTPRPEDPVCALLRRRFGLRVWPPYAVGVCKYTNCFSVTICHGPWETGPQYYFALSSNEIGPGGADLADRRFDDAFKRLREIVAKGSLMTGVQA